MKIRELAAEWEEAQSKAETEYIYVRGEVLAEALAEMDAKLQEFQAYWRNAYPEGFVGHQAASVILDALQVAFEIPTARMKDEDNSVKERI